MDNPLNAQANDASASLETSISVIRVADREGVVHELEPVEGWRLMEILRDYGMGMNNTCGGALACAECHVVLDPEWAAKVPSPTDEEIEKLDELPLLFEHSRLSCQIIWSDDYDGLRLRIV
jgi:2Fe-2S ferredoxin